MKHISCPTCGNLITVATESRSRKISYYLCQKCGGKVANKKTGLFQKLFGSKQKHDGENLGLNKEISHRGDPLHPYEILDNSGEKPACITFSSQPDHLRDQTQDTRQREGMLFSDHEYADAFLTPRVPPEARRQQERVAAQLFWHSARELYTRHGRARPTAPSSQAQFEVQLWIGPYGEGVVLLHSGTGCKSAL